MSQALSNHIFSDMSWLKLIKERTAVVVGMMTDGRDLSAAFTAGTIKPTEISAINTALVYRVLEVLDLEQTDNKLQLYQDRGVDGNDVSILLHVIVLLRRLFKTSLNSALLSLFQTCIRYSPDA